MIVTGEHVEFGPLIRAMASEQMAEENRKSRALLRGAIVDGSYAWIEARLRNATVDTLPVSPRGEGPSWFSTSSNVTGHASWKNLERHATDEDRTEWR